MKNQKYLDSRALSILLFVFAFLMYAVVYMTKCMFSSAMATIVEEGVMTKSQTGLINAVFWCVYAIFQVFGGFAADKYSSHKLIMIGLGGAIISNIIIYLNQSYFVMMTVWALNAIAQFGLWPGLFKIISTQLSHDVRKSAVFIMMFSTSVGLGLSMLIASFVSHWKQNFLVSVISLLITTVLYAVIYSVLSKKMVEDDVDIKGETKKTEEKKTPMLPLMLSSGLIGILIVCLLRVAIDNGIKMMTPVMLMESYSNLPAAISTRMSSVLIIFSAFGIISAGIMQKHIARNEMKAQIIFYSLSILPLFAVCFVGHIHYGWILTALCISVLLIHGAGPFSQSFIALHFVDYGRVGTVSGILNATASVGNILASYVFARMAELMPWEGVAISWLASILICGLICLFSLQRWTKFTDK